MGDAFDWGRFDCLRHEWIFGSVVGRPKSLCLGSYNRVNEDLKYPSKLVSTPFLVNACMFRSRIPKFIFLWRKRATVNSIAIESGAKNCIQTTSSIFIQLTISSKRVHVPFKWQDEAFFKYFRDSFVSHEIPSFKPFIIPMKVLHLSVSLFYIHCANRFLISSFQHWLFVRLFLA